MDGLHGDGDVFNPANQEAFVKFVKENTDGLGVHVVMADGVSPELLDLGPKWVRLGSNEKNPGLFKIFQYILAQ